MMLRSNKAKGVVLIYESSMVFDSYAGVRGHHRDLRGH